jgi:PKHD-type hydroxylase
MHAGFASLSPMLLAFHDVLTAEEVRTLRTELASLPFVEGARTAGPGSRSRKNNVQLSDTDPRATAARAFVRDALSRNQAFQFLVLPQRIMTPMFNRYDVGMYYEDHVDFPLLGPPPPLRADLSVTLFLSSPDEYEGGELVIRTGYGDQTVKLPAGAAVVYPAYYIHRVEPVARGSRWAAITTVQSAIREESRRDLIADLVRLMRWVQDVAPLSEEARLVNKIHANLLRLWAET